MKYRCCICGEEKEDYGHDPYPIKDQGKCCDKCNYTIVLPARLAKSKEFKNKENK